VSAPDLSDQEKAVLKSKKDELEKFRKDLRVQWEDLASKLGCTADQAKRIVARYEHENPV
jgi:hypothetical protein